MIGLITVRDGDRVALWDKAGRMKLVDGPRRVVLFRKTVQPVRRHSAAADQYLVVKFRDGHAEHLRGPASVWFDPVLHAEVKVEDALAIDAHEAVVVYSRTNGEVRRRVVRGPALHVPTADEWLHEFVWHGSDPTNPIRKVPYALKFNKLRVIPDQTYVDVPDVRTSDDALIIVRLMVFFELSDILKMLDQTHDPVADFVNAVTADVIDFAGTRTFERFKEETERLSDLATYKHLTGRAARIGYTVNKVVYRGYLASPKLQAMHDGAIESRTRLRLEAETERQAQDLADLKTRRETERAEERRKVDHAQAEHETRLQRMKHDEAMREAQTIHTQQIDHRRQIDAAQLDRERATHEEKTAYLERMKTLQIDLTRWLVARYQHPDRLIRIEGNGDRRVHLHEHE